MDRVIVFTRPDGSVHVTSPPQLISQHQVLVSAAVPAVPAVTRPETDAEVTAALASAAGRAATPETFLEALRAGLPAEVFALVTGNGAADQVTTLLKAPPAALLDLLRGAVEIELAKPEVPEVYRSQTDDEKLATMIASGLPPDAMTPWIVERAALPTVSDFRDCWMQDGGAVRIDMDRARAKRLAEIRVARDAALKATDVRALRDMEAEGKVSDDVKALRQALRDLPATFDLQAATPEALAAVWPAELPPRPVAPAAPPAAPAAIGPPSSARSPSLPRPRGPRAIPEGVAR